jgi:hypothetical protein
VKRIWPGRSRSTSGASGSLTFTTISAAANTASASGAIVAPWAAYWESLKPLAAPAPCWTATSCPRSVSSRTPAGVIDTRYSSAFVSLGIPTFTNVLLDFDTRWEARGSRR